MIRVDFIRHGKTQGNLEGRYVGVTDEALCQQGREALLKLCEEGIYPEAQAVFSSPMKRCLETAEILYGGCKVSVIAELAETDFGLFEYKNYEELNGNEAYQAWIDSNGTMDIPGAESAKAFSDRMEKGFQKLLALSLQGGFQHVACVVHGGVIMKLMNLYAVQREDYYYWQMKNGRGLSVMIDERKIDFLGRI